MQKKLLVLYFLIFLFGGQGCQDRVKKSKKFPSREAVHYAQGFELSQKEGIDLIYLFQGDTDTLSYALYRKEGDLEKAEKLGIPIKLPVQEFIALSSPYTAMLEALDARSNIRAIAKKEYIYSAELVKLVEAGKVAEVGPESVMDTESTAKLGADLLLYSASPAMRDRKFGQLESLGLICVPMGEWLEESLLGRAEWMKVVAAFLDKEEMADSLFMEIESAYKLQLTKLQDLDNRPMVMSSMPFKGVWHVPGAKSYMARIIEEAGGSYAWRDQGETASIPLAFEAVYPIGLQADIWIGPGAVSSYEDLLARDERFVDFLPYQKKKIYHNYKRSNDKGGNDYWESAVVRPHIVLKDLIHIFHPEIVPNHQSVYFDPLE